MRALLARAFEGERRDRLWGGAAFACVLVCLLIALAPTFRDLELYGGHDWDEMTAHRLLTVRSLLRYHQLPLWMPYACGGYSEWGNVVGGTNLVSPFLPLYLLFELRLALRLELLGSLLISAAGSWCLAAQFARSAALRAFACLLFVANGRWALQAATGHLWHLEYCYLPWAFWAFERLLTARRLGGKPLLIGAELRARACPAAVERQRQLALPRRSVSRLPVRQRADLSGPLCRARAARGQPGRPQVRRTRASGAGAAASFLSTHRRARLQ
jgi:hypothetical protein